jgi:hypothetical protein
VREHVRLEIGALRESLVAAVEGAHKRPVARVDSDMRAQIEIEAELLSTAFEWTLIFFFLLLKITN